MQNKVLALILAAGKGSRMKSNIPKPLNHIYNKPMISWIIDSFKNNNIDISIIINPLHKKYFTNYSKEVSFIYQYNPLGTGHAVIQAKEHILKYDYTFIFVGDSPFVNSNIISRMYNSHINNNSDCTILSSLFREKKFPYARIIRDEKKIMRFVEEKDASKSDLKIDELFCSHYLFKSNILIEFLDYLKPHKDNNEIYLTDILNQLILNKKNIHSINIQNWKRLVGLNTIEDIKWLESQKII
tara:strand:- start:1470 stop:2195 length:726 start_codon:yes stop_codon:yes gene_type:complete